MLGPDPDVAKQVRKFVFDHFRELAVPPVLEQIMERFRCDRSAAFALLQALEAARHLKLVPGTQRILMAFPFSAIATPFRVVAGNRRYYANCAWDAVALHATLGERIRIESSCHDCAAPFTVDLAEGRVTSSSVPEPLVYLALPAARWWEDIVATCSNHMVFFLSQDHLDHWAAEAGGGGEALTVEKTHALGLPIYRDKMSLEYARPSRDALVAHLHALGLAGDFWRI